MKLNLFSNFDEVPFICSFPSETHITHMLADLILFHRSLTLCSFFFNLFILSSSDEIFYWSLFRITGSSFFHHTSSTDWVHVENFWSLLFCIFRYTNFYLVLTIVFFFLIYSLHLLIQCYIFLWFFKHGFILWTYL